MDRRDIARIDFSKRVLNRLGSASRGDDNGLEFALNLAAVNGSFARSDFPHLFEGDNVKGSEMDLSTSGSGIDLVSWAPGVELEPYEHLGGYSVELVVSGSLRLTRWDIEEEGNGIYTLNKRDTELFGEGKRIVFPARVGGKPSIAYSVNSDIHSETLSVYAYSDRINQGRKYTLIDKNKYSREEFSIDNSNQFRG